LFPAKEINWTIEHLPAGVDFEKIESSNIKKVQIRNGSGRVGIIEWKPTLRILSIEGAEPSTIKVNTFNFPGWAASIDGRLTQIRTDEGTRAMIIDIPSGKHFLKLAFQDTPVRLYGKIISLFTLLSMLLVLPVKRFLLKKVYK
jgi:hypothetical protein